MKIKEAVNQRFITAINYLIENKIEPSKQEIASKLCLKKSTFSEILKQRSGVGVESIVYLSQLWNISVEWLLLNKGSMILNQQNSDEPKNLNEKIIKLLDENNSLKDQKIKELECEIKKLKSGVTFPVRNIPTDTQQIVNTGKQLESELKK